MNDRPAVAAVHDAGQSIRMVGLLVIVGLLAAILLGGLAVRAAVAGGLGLPSSRGVIGFGNLAEFNGVRFNLVDRDVQRVNGINVTFWAPIHGYGDDERGMHTAGGTLNGVGLNLLGAGADRMNGVHVGLLGLGVGERAHGVLVGGLGIGGEALTGVFLGGLGVGGERLTGGAFAGLGIGGQDLRGVFAAGLGIGAQSMQGVAVSTFIGTRETRGVALALLHQRTERLYGIAAGLYNRADHAEGLMLGLVNSTRTLRGVQIGLVNHVDSGPAAARVLPVVNARF